MTQRERPHRWFMAFLFWLAAVIATVKAEIREARKTKRIKPKRFDPEHIPVVLPPSMGPLVETQGSDHPLPLTCIPIRSTKADAKREAHRYAEQRAGHPLTWKQARRLMNQWGREEREVERSMDPAYAARMRELSEQAG